MQNFVYIIWYEYWNHIVSCPAFIYGPVLPVCGNIPRINKHFVGITANVFTNMWENPTTALGAWSSVGRKKNNREL